MCVPLSLALRLLHASSSVARHVALIVAQAAASEGRGRGLGCSYGGVCAALKDKGGVERDELLLRGHEAQLLGPGLGVPARCVHLCELPWIEPLVLLEEALKVGHLQHREVHIPR